ncbi:MAG: hypothetical protein PHO70_01065 [Candidatus Omnitrophica bacterium]|nr:hypothetical protein [Candidatus Omnitrophota bacterium]
MLRYHLRKKGQSTLEYAILIGVIVAGLIAMQTYIKRGYEGKLRESADTMGKQYNPEDTTYNYTTSTSSLSTEVVSDSKTTTTIQNQTSNRTGNETVGGVTNETLF